MYQSKERYKELLLIKSLKRYVFRSFSKDKIQDAFRKLYRSWCTYIKGSICHHTFCCLKKELVKAPSQLSEGIE